MKNCPSASESSDPVSYTHLQYDEIQVYDYSVVFDKEMGTWRQDHFQKEAADYVDDMIFVHEGTADLLTGKTAKSVNLVASDNEHFDQFVKLHNPDGTKLNYPSAGQAVICRKLADEYDLAVGDKITLRDENMKKMELTVSGVCQNFVYNYVYVSPQTCQDQWGYTPEIKSALVNAKDGMDAVSYTHLDVYKRQLLYGPIRTFLHHDHLVAAHVEHPLAPHSFLDVLFFGVRQRRPIKKFHDSLQIFFFLRICIWHADAKFPHVGEFKPVADFGGIHALGDGIDPVSYTHLFVSYDNIVT